MRQKDKPWEALSMSRATWYRYGKPDKPFPRHELMSLCEPKKGKRFRRFSTEREKFECTRKYTGMGWSFRTWQRFQRLAKEASPELLELVDKKKITIGEAERRMVYEQIREALRSLRTAEGTGG